jgi:hypothetical protein
MGRPFGKALTLDGMQGVKGDAIHRCTFLGGVSLFIVERYGFAGAIDR